MKFGALLRTSAEEVPELQQLYSCYKQLKKRLKLLPEKQELARQADRVAQGQRPAVNVRELLHQETDFVQTLDQDVQEFNSLFLDKEEDNVIRLRSLEDAAAAATTTDHIERVYKQFVDFHGELLLLVHWSILAYTGLVKILKKHHKRTGLLVKAPHLDNLLSQPFCSVEVLTELIRKAEQAVNRLANKLGAHGAAPTLSSSPQKTSVEQLLNATRSSVEEMAAAGSGSVLGSLDAEPASSSEGLDDEESDWEDKAGSGASKGQAEGSAAEGPCKPPQRGTRPSPGAAIAAAAMAAAAEALQASPSSPPEAKAPAADGYQQGLGASDGTSDAADSQRQRAAGTWAAAADREAASSAADSFDGAPCAPRHRVAGAKRMHLHSRAAADGQAVEPDCAHPHGCIPDADADGQVSEDKNPPSKRLHRSDSSQSSSAGQQLHSRPPAAAVHAHNPLAGSTAAWCGSQAAPGPLPEAAAGRSPPEDQPGSGPGPGRDAGSRQPQRHPGADLLAGAVVPAGSSVASEAPSDLAALHMLPSIMRQTQAALGLWEQLHETASTPSTVLPRFPASVVHCTSSAATDQSEA